MVELRAVQAADLPIFFEQQWDPQATQMAAFPARERPAFMAHWHKILADATLTAQTILCDGQVAGNIGSWEQDGAHAVGYWLGRPYWGRGVATQALVAFLKQVTVRPLYAHVALHNIASRRVLEKCGFLMLGGDQGSTGAGDQDVDEVLLILS